MTATAAPKRIGTFEFRVAVSEKKASAEQRAAAMTNWLLAEWQRERATTRRSMVKATDGCR